MTLLDIFHNHTGLPTEKYPHHLEAYENFFAPFRGKEIGFLEIGIGNGGSLEMWRKYFGKNARIYGLDIQDIKPKFPLFVGNQGDRVFMEETVLKTIPLHIVVDDGSHQCYHQVVSFEVLFPRLEDGGVYIVEDIHTSYRAAYLPDMGRGESFVSYLKRMVDSLHKNETGETYHPAWDHVFAVHFYPGLAIIEKKSPSQWGGPQTMGWK